MANTKIFDDQKVQMSLSRLLGPARVSLARSMGVAGGKVFRDAAKAFCPVGGDMSVSARLAGESNRPGDIRSTYAISWNHKIAPHGHLVEFGHWQPFKAYLGKNGEWYTNTTATQDPPRWIAAHPFLRPAFDGAQGLAKAAMVARGKERLPELLREARA